MTNVETACVPFYRPMVAPWYGCNGNTCKSHCWYFNRVVPRMAANPSIKCLDCKTGKPHLHDILLPKNGGHVYSGHMGEIADLKGSEILSIRSWALAWPDDIFQLFTHRLMEFYTKYPDWPDNVWAFGTFTEGLIQFPPNLKAGVIGAYCEPIMGEIDLPRDETQVSWGVIGLLNHSKNQPHSVSQLGYWVENLMIQFRVKQIPIFCKNMTNPLWAKMGIDPIQQWPKVTP